jgi:hypothetical protein
MTKDQNKMRLSSKLLIIVITLTFNLTKFYKTMKNSFTSSIKFSKNNWKINKFNLRMLCKINQLVLLELEDTLKHKIMLKIKIHLSNNFHSSIVTICTSWKNSCKIFKWKWVNLKMRNTVWLKKSFRWRTKPKG